MSCLALLAVCCPPEKALNLLRINPPSRILAFCGQSSLTGNSSISAALFVLVKARKSLLLVLSGPRSIPRRRHGEAEGSGSESGPGAAGSV